MIWEKVSGVNQNKDFPVSTLRDLKIWYGSGKPSRNDIQKTFNKNPTAIFVCQYQRYPVCCIFSTDSFDIRFIFYLFIYLNSYFAFELL